MKRSLLFTLAFALIAGGSVTAQQKTVKVDAPAKAEVKDSLLPYQKHAKLPAFNILKMDSTTVFNTEKIPEGKPIILFYFGPECDHCQKLLEKLLPGFDSLSDTRIYMITFANTTPLKNFYERYHLSKYKNIEMGRDHEFFFSSWYGARFVPYLAVYDKHKNFVEKFESTVTMHDLYAATLKKGITPSEVVNKKYKNK